MKDGFIYFEDSWNEYTKKDRTGEILDGRTSSTRETKDDTKRPRGQK